MSMLSKHQLKQFIASYNIQSTDNIQAALKNLFADTLQAMLEGELDAHLGYAKYALQDKQTSNRSNGCSRKP